MPATPTNPSEPKKDKRKKNKKKGGPSDEWYTPQRFVNALAKLLDLTFVLDVAATLQSKKADAFFGKRHDGLSMDWHVTAQHLGDSDTPAVWMNPPYSAPGPWVAKAAKTARDGTTVVALLRSSTGTLYWLGHVWPYAAEVNFVTSRMAYEKADGTAGAKSNHDSAVIVWRPGHTGPPRVRVIDTDGNVVPVGLADAPSIPAAAASSSLDVVCVWPQGGLGEEAA